MCFTVIYSHPAVEEVAAIAIPDNHIGNAIEVVVVIQAGCKLTKSQLSAFCAERLPKYMIPGLIEWSESLPKTSTGKIDRTLLRREHLVNSVN
ncbi:MAG: hypothetical protein AB4290_13225 [Spirulina sp.]